MIVIVFQSRFMGFSSTCFDAICKRCSLMKECGKDRMLVVQREF